MDPSIYSSGEYWAKNPGFHEEDSVFKFTEACKLLDSNDVTPHSILDCGCGGGLVAYLFAKKYSVPTTGLDLSPPLIARASEKYLLERLEYRVGQIQDLEDNAFDMGVMFDVFEHVEDYIDLLRTAREKARTWLFNIPMDMTVASLLSGSYMRMRKSVGHLHYFTEASALATLRTAGFQVVDTRFANKIPHEFSKGITLSKVLTGVPQQMLFWVSPHLSVLILGGASLLVLASRN